MVLHLDDADVIARGGERLVFIHPTQPKRLIKVLRERPAEMFTRWTFGHLTQRYFPSARHRPVMKQYHEYARLAFEHQRDPDFVMPVSHLYGFCQTSLGLGGITERVTNDAGENGPTLADLVAGNALNDALLESFNAFVDRLFRVGVAVGDVSPTNFVRGWRHIVPGGAASGPDWVMVDGFGDRHAVPIRSVSRRARIWGLDDCFRRNPLVTGLRWNARARRIERTD